MAHTPIHLPDISGGQLMLTAWTDPVIDELGHDPRSTYVELFWLGTLGPSAVWLLRHLARRLESVAPGYEPDTQPSENTDLSHHAEGVAIDVDETARAIGLASGARRHSSFEKTLERLVRFNIARTVDSSTLAVRRNLAPLTRRQLERLSPARQSEHQTWNTTSHRPPLRIVSQERTRQLALTLVQLGESADDTADQLRRWRIGETAATAAAQWAWSRQLHPSGA